MKLHQVIGAIALCLALGFALSLAASEQPESKELSSSSGRSSAVLPKLFDFDRFKTVFRRQYSSIIEELARKKIFLAKAFKVFVAFFKYKHNKADKFLGINEMSDWTDAEHDAILLKRPLAAKVATTVAETPVADVEEVKAGLEKLAQLTGERRRKREVVESGSSKKELLTEDDLFGLPAPDEQLAEVESNNPDYEVPELFSFGVDANAEDSARPELEPAKSSYLASLPGAGYINSLLNTVSDYLFVVEPTEEQTKGLTPVVKPDQVYVDHRNSDCLINSKYQGGCGSCYIFATTSLYEWHYCKQNGEKVSFAEQYPLDCGERAKLEGCNGGYPDQVAGFYGRFGAEMRKNYPYRYRSDICPYDPEVKSKHMGYIKLKEKDGSMVEIEYKNLQKFLNSAPLVLDLSVPDDFRDYAGGVDDGSRCNPEKGHAMLVVGSGIEDGNEYWLFRNSYGASWGLKGHYKLNKKAFHCLWEEGKGYGIRPNEKVFKSNPNTQYDARFVKKRRQDVINRRPIPPNPFNIPEEDEGAVTPPPL